MSIIATGARHEGRRLPYSQGGTDRLVSYHDNFGSGPVHHAKEWSIHSRWLHYIIHLGKSASIPMILSGSDPVNDIV